MLIVPFRIHRNQESKFMCLISRIIRKVRTLRCSVYTNYVVAPKYTYLGVLVRNNNVPIGLYKTHRIWLVAGIEWVTLGMKAGWRQKVWENECRNVWMQVIKQLKRMNGMSVLVNDIKMVGVQKMTFSDWN